MFLKIFVSFFALSFCVLEAEARGNYNVFKKVQTFLSEAKEYQENGEVAIEGRRTSSDEECLVLSLTMLTLFMPDGACDGIPSNSTESFDDFSPETFGQFYQIDGCMDALIDSYTALNDKECFDDGSGDDGGDTAVSMMKYACVEHPDGTLCVEKMSFLFDDESDNSLNCTHFTGYVPSFSLSLSLSLHLLVQHSRIHISLLSVGCCLGTMKKLNKCMQPDDPWANSDDASDPYLTMCPGIGLSSTPCDGTPDTCGASSLTMSVLASFASMFLFVLNR